MIPLPFSGVKINNLSITALVPQTEVHPNNEAVFLARIKEGRQESKGNHH